MYQSGSLVRGDLIKTQRAMLTVVNYWIII